MLNKQMENQLASFRQEGGFTEALTAERLSVRVQREKETDAPNCPKCGKPMIKRMAKKKVKMQAMPSGVAPTIRIAAEQEVLLNG